MSAQEFMAPAEVKQPQVEVPEMAKPVPVFEAPGASGMQSLKDAAYPQIYANPDNMKVDQKEVQV